MQLSDVSDVVSLINACRDFSAANLAIQKLTGLQSFFPDAIAYLKGQAIHHRRDSVTR